MMSRIALALKWWSAVLAAALVLTYLAVVSWTDVSVVAFGPAGKVLLGIAAVCCGALLALAGERGVVAIAVAGGIAVFAFGLTWSIIASQLIGRMFTSFLELGMSDTVSLYVLPRAALVAVTTILPGVLGAGVVQALVPERSRP